MKVLTITQEEKSLLLRGSVVKVGGVNVVLDANGKPCECVSSNNPYPAVIPSTLRPADTLNLTDNETIDAMKKGETIVYRSSGAKNSMGKPYTREQQIKLGVARTIKVTATLKDENNKENPFSYDWRCFEQVSCGEPVKLMVVTNVEEF